MDVDAGYRRPLAMAAAWIALAVGLLVAFVTLPVLHFALPSQWNAALHTILETISIVVSALVFSAGAIRVPRKSMDRIAFAGTGFLAVAILDFLHVLSYEGMPEFVTPSGAGKAIVFFLAARLIAVLGLLMIAIANWQQPEGRWRRGFGIGSLAFAAAVAVVGLDPRVKSWFFVPGEGLTPLKVACEYVLVALNALAAAAFLARMRTPQPYPVVQFLIAAALMAVSELCFSLYATPTDQYNNLGHVLKVAAYLFVYRGLLQHVVTRPYLELERAHAELDAANASLEKRVRERTAQLEATNRDLEAFSYSVAHDLRAPLQAINGFAGALESRIGDGRPDEARLLGRIRANSVAMDEMIDGLLELSRLSRSQPRREALDLAPVADQIIDQLRQAEPARDVAVSVHGPLPAVGDPALLRTALQNLIGNAWKFTLGRPQPRIDVGTLREQGELVFFVRDNGAGFHMDHAAKLFVLFQRLHTSPAYPGHGIGLVNVRRIVALHGGRIWAEGKVDEGATFYFTLPADTTLVA